MQNGKASLYLKKHKGCRGIFEMRMLDYNLKIEEKKEDTGGTFVKDQKEELLTN